MQFIYPLLITATLLFGEIPYIKYLVKNDVVRLSTGNGTATGFHLNYEKKTYIITNMHVCTYEQVTVELFETMFGIDARLIKERKPLDYLNSVDGRHKVLKVYYDVDLCILESNKKNGLDLADSYNPNLPTYITGHPAGDPLTITKGYIVGIETDKFPWLEKPASYLIFDNKAVPGNSGSPVVNLLGNVIGIVFATNNYLSNGIVMPLNVLKAKLKEFHESRSK